jgi:hypothetical protein
MPISRRLMPERHEAINWRRHVHDSRDSKHRSMPELDEFAKLAMSMLGNGSKNEQ